MADVDNSGQLVDLDVPDGNSINFFAFTDDFRSGCRSLNITFSCTKQLYFKNDGTTWFTAMGENWEPLTVEETTNKDLWQYKCKCFPKNAMKINQIYIKDAKDLADAFGVDFDAIDNNQNVELPVPLKNVSLLSILLESRRMSMILNHDDLKNAIYLYYDGSSLMSNVLQTIFNSKAVLLDDSGILGQIIPTYCDIRNDMTWSEQKNTTPGYMSTANYFEKILGAMYEVKTASPLRMFTKYTIPESYCHSEFEDGLVCIKQYCCSEFQPNCWTATLAEIKWPEE